LFVKTKNDSMTVKIARKQINKFFFITTSKKVLMIIKTENVVI